MNEHPILFRGPMVRAILEGRKTMTRRVVTEKCALSWLLPTGFTPEFVAHPENHLCRYGNAGDRLWVKETFVAFPDGNVFYRADNDDRTPVNGWKPSIFMPRKLSRLTLEVVSVHVERLQDISEQDAKAEGCEASIDTLTDGYFTISARGFFEDLWDSINAKRGYGWDANPWVWVVEFRRIK